MPQRRESQPGAETPQQHAARIGKSLTNVFALCRRIGPPWTHQHC